MLRLLIGSLAIGTTGYFGYVTLNYFYFLMQQLALLFVPIIGLFVAAEIILITRLEKHRSPTVARIGKILGGAITYTFLFQGILFTTIVLWAVSVGFGFGGDGPADRAEFLGDFLIGAGYLSAFILGATGLTVLFSGTVPARIAGAFYAIVTIAIPVGCLAFAEADMKALAASRPGAFAAAVIVYLLAASAVGMALLVHGMGVGPSKPNKTRLATPKGRLPG